LFQPSVIFFDAVGTLIHPHPKVEETYARLGRQRGSALTPSQIAPRFHAAFRRQEEWDRGHGHVTDETRERQRWQAIVAEVFDDLPDTTEPFEDLWEFFAQPVAWVCYPDVASCLEWLHQSGIGWGIASNFDCRLRAVVAGTPLLRNCRFLAISSEIGWRKPAAEFFAALPAITGLPLTRLLLIGNDETNDLQGSHAAGLTAVLLVRHSGRATAPAITSLGQLPQWLKESGAIR
jgi:putative hydrolase of the HAD superfamily